MQEFAFRPYSLRRGGATFWFQKHQNLDKILVQGRWQTQRSARIYLNEGLAVLSQLRVPRDDPRVKPFMTVFCNFLSLPRFLTLEPPAVGGRAGGVGKTKPRGKGKAAFLFLFCAATVRFLHSPTLRRRGSVKVR